MNKNTLLIMFFLYMLLSACSSNHTNKQNDMIMISDAAIHKTINTIKSNASVKDTSLITRGVNNVAKFWKEQDGSEQDFIDFCIKYYMTSDEERNALALRLQDNFENIYGNYNRISVALKMPLHVTGLHNTAIDEKFAAFDPFAHFSDDMFDSKIAFITLLNFPFYNLEEKNTLGKTWNREEWSYARLGDWFNARVPSDATQQLSDCLADADNYIANYNIVMGNLRNTKGEQLFPSDMHLITHWGLRDEIKSNYSNTDGRGLEKQRMIYEIIQHIINQTIPQEVISNSNYIWYPFENKVYNGNEEIKFSPEPNTRYEKLYATYKAVKEIDKYCPIYNTYMQRSFDQLMEVSDKELEDMFIAFISSSEVKDVANIIKKRLGRDLEPFDIWYDGFKNRSSLNENELTEHTKKIYPNELSFSAALPTIMCKLGFSTEKANSVCSKIIVDPSKGAGHAWGAMSKDDKSRLRTRISETGMDYKGYNIAIHEFGHNVEQTISIHDVDYYSMGGVPSTAFSEALAFVFQTRDLELLGYKNEDAMKKLMYTLDNFWGCYEIMGVSLVDIYTWRWLYENPNATVSDLKKTVIENAKMVWNKYYAPIFGIYDSSILACYSHMICYPLYLPNYPYGHIVESQIETLFNENNIGNEVCRIYSIGKVTPNIWMQNAVGTPVSVQPLLDATREAIDQLTDY